MFERLVRRLTRFPSSQVEVGPRLDYLNVGCGACYHPAWHNLDANPIASVVRRHDIRQRLPYPAERFDVVYHSHVLEHVARSDGRAFLRECWRVLRPGGVIRVVVPDLEDIARAYLRELDAVASGDASAIVRLEWMTIELLDQMTRERPGGEMLAYWLREPMPAFEFVLRRIGAELAQARPALRSGSGATSRPRTGSREDFRESGELHRWMYDRISLAVLLAEIGFSDVRRRTAGQSQIPDFERFGLDVQKDGSIRSVRKPDSLFMEAIKPRATEGL